MREVTIYSPGDIDSSGTPRNLTTAPAMLRMRIMPKSVAPKVKSTCLPLGGQIKATVPEITHVESADPEPGVGYGWSRECKVHHAKNNPSGVFIRSATCGDGRSGGFLWT